MFDVDTLQRHPGVDIGTPEADSSTCNFGARRYTSQATADAYRKLLATLQARTALWGGSLTATESDHGEPMFIVTRWALTRAFDSLGEVEDWLQRVEGGGHAA